MYLYMYVFLHVFICIYKNMNIEYMFFCFCSSFHRFVYLFHPIISLSYVTHLNIIPEENRRAKHIVHMSLRRDNLFFFFYVSQQQLREFCAVYTFFSSSGRLCSRIDSTETLQARSESLCLCESDVRFFVKKMAGVIYPSPLVMFLSTPFYFLSKLNH